jgi:spectinomycin phosphotransferase
MRNMLTISEDKLRSCLEQHYGLTPISLEFLPLGLDTRSALFRALTEEGIDYLLKARQGSFYEPGCLVPRYLYEQGIDSVVAPILTRWNTLWATFEDWTVVLYPFIDGDTSWMGISDEHWHEVGRIIKRIHQAALPARGIQSLHKEAFDPAEYVRWVRAIESQYLGERSEDELPRRALRSSWTAHQSIIGDAVTSLEKLAEFLQRRSGPYVICHADLHPANLIRDSAGRVYLIDWDDVMLAPKERDFIFVKESADVAQDNSPFFQGYGQTEIDWIALAYFRWERVIQDLIECARTVFLRDDLGEEIKADAVRLFEMIVTERREIQAAQAAASHIPFKAVLIDGVPAGVIPRQPYLPSELRQNEESVESKPLEIRDIGTLDPLIAENKKPGEYTAQDIIRALGIRLQSDSTETDRSRQPEESSGMSDVRIETDYIKLPDASSFADVLGGGLAAISLSKHIHIDAYNIGNLELTTGRIIASDALIAGPRPFQTVVPGGHYPVLIAVARFDDDERIAFARVQFADRPAERWAMAITGGQDPSTLKPGYVFCYGVDSGMGAFIEEAALGDITTALFLTDGGFSRLEKELSKVYRHTRNWARINTTHGNAVIFSSGFGDGYYASYFGYDGEDELVALMTDFLVVDWKQEN